MINGKHSQVCNSKNNDWQYTQNYNYIYDNMCMSMCMISSVKMRRGEAAHWAVGVAGKWMPLVHLAMSEYETWTPECTTLVHKHPSASLLGSFLRAFSSNFVS